MLFVAFPDSTSSLRLMVIVLLSGGGSLSAGELATASADVVGASGGRTVLGAEMFLDAALASDAYSAGAARVWVDSFGVVAEVGSSGPIPVGSDESTEDSCH